MVHQIPAIHLGNKTRELTRLDAAKKIEHGLAGLRRFAFRIEVGSAQGVGHILDKLDRRDLDGADLDSRLLAKGSEIERTFRQRGVVAG